MFAYFELVEKCERRNVHMWLLEIKVAYLCLIDKYGLADLNVKQPTLTALTQYVVNEIHALV